MHCIIASKNEGKVKTISDTIRGVYPHLSLTFESCPVNIEGLEQPWGDDSTKNAAMQRIEYILRTKTPTEGTTIIAQESGLRTTESGQVEIINTTVIYLNGHYFIGWAKPIPLKEDIRKLVQDENIELADAFARVYKNETDRQGKGGVFVMTDGNTTRPKLIAEATRDAIKKMKALGLKINPAATANSSPSAHHLACE